MSEQQANPLIDVPALSERHSPDAQAPMRPEMRRIMDLVLRQGQDWRKELEKYRPTAITAPTYSDWAIARHNELIDEIIVRIEAGLAAEARTREAGSSRERPSLTGEDNGNADASLKERNTADEYNQQSNGSSG